MTNERDALYEAILLDPDSDVPRLVYADWLQENPHDAADTARSEFIRHEIAAERAEPDCPVRIAHETAAAELWNRFGDDWNAEIPAWNTWYESRLIYRRGFPDELRTGIRRFKMAGHELLPSLPVRTLRLKSQAYVNVQHCWWSVGNPSPPDLSRIRTLQLDALGVQGAMTQNLLGGLGSFPPLANLVRLELSGCGLNAEWLIEASHWLPQSVFAQSLRELDLSDNQLTSAAGMFLATSARFENLERIQLAGNRMNKAARKALVDRFGDGVTFDESST